MNWHWLVETPKTRSGLVITRTVQLVLVLALVIGGLVLWEDGARGEADRTTTSQRIHPTEEQVSSWKHKGARKFRHHKLDSSGGRRMPKKVVRAMDAYAAKRGMTFSKDDPPWWHQALDKYTCMWNAAGSPYFTPWASFCVVYGENPTVRAINRRITKVRVLCGGAAVIGALRGGGAWGAVTGAGLCALGNSYEVYEKWTD